jgi:hypothetical protein
MMYFAGVVPASFNPILSSDWTNATDPGPMVLE